MVDRYDGYAAIVLREAELDGTQAIADALEIKDAEPGLSFNGVRLITDPNAPIGSLWLVADNVHVHDGKDWIKVAHK